jgi:hypothetical protein
MVTEGQRVWRAGQGGGESRRSALGAWATEVGGPACLAACGGTPDGSPSSGAPRLNAVLNERFWTGAVTAAQTVKEVKERGDPILKG